MLAYFGGLYAYKHGAVRVSMWGCTRINMGLYVHPYPFRSPLDLDGIFLQDHCYFIIMPCVTLKGASLIRGWTIWLLINDFRHPHRLR